MKKRKPQPQRPPVAAPHEVLGIVEGEQARCNIFVVEIKVTGVTAKGATVKVGVNVWGDQGITVSSLDLLRPSAEWCEFVAAMIPGASGDIDIDQLVTRSCAATGTAVAWQPGRPWTLFSAFKAGIS